VWLIHSSEVFLFFNVIPKQIDASVLSWHCSYSRTAIFLSLSHNQWLPKWVIGFFLKKISSSTCAAFTYIHIMTGGSSTIFELSAPFSGMLLSHYTSTVHLCHLVVNCSWGKHSLLVKAKSHIQLKWCHCTSVYHLNSTLLTDWLLCHVLHVTCTTGAASHRGKNAWLTYKLETREALLIGHASSKPCPFHVACR
jgi:hypothetical protein